MKNRALWPVALLAGSMLLSGCAGAADAAAPVTPRPTHTSHAPADPGEPSDAAQMICGPKTVDAVVTILALAEPPHIVKTWADGLYTCTYHLPAGALVLSVQESTDAAAALAHSHELATTFPSTSPIEGLANLGFPGYETPDGIVVFVKDNMTLEVDASALPAKLGPHDITGNALAYQLATDVLACWTGH